VKSILLHVAEDSGFAGRLEAALDVTRATGGHLSLLQTRRVPAYFGADAAGFGAGAALVAELLEQEAKIGAEARARIEAQLVREDVSWTFSDAMGEPAESLIAASTLNDLVVMSLAQPGEAPQAAVADVVIRSDTPVLAMPPGSAGFQVGRPAVVGWKPTAESAKALKAAAPFLRLASSVAIVVVDPAEAGDLPPTEAATYLSRHGIKADVMERRSGGQSVSQTLNQAVSEIGAGLLVMGAYSRSRALQFLLGGVTKDFLDGSPVPLLMAH
jgi:nucleotide-binding universal stress UspA family protein